MPRTCRDVLPAPAGAPGPTKVSVAEWVWHETGGTGSAGTFTWEHGPATIACGAACSPAPTPALLLLLLLLPQCPRTAPTRKTLVMIARIHAARSTVSSRFQAPVTVLLTRR